MEFIRKKLKRKFPSLKDSKPQNTGQVVGGVNIDHSKDFMLSNLHEENPETKSREESDYTPWELDQYQVCHYFGGNETWMVRRHQFQRHRIQVYEWNRQDSEYWKVGTLHHAMISRNKNDNSFESKNRHEMCLPSISKTARSHGQELYTDQKLELLPQTYSKQGKFEESDFENSECINKYKTDLPFNILRDYRNKISEGKGTESEPSLAYSINEGPQIVVMEAEDEPMHSSASSISLDSVSTGSSVSVTHGSYNLWESSDEGSTEDLNKNILKSDNNCLGQICSCTDSTCGNIHRSQLENSLRRKLIPILRDFESNESLNSIDFQIKPKKETEDGGMILHERKHKCLEDGGELVSGSKSDCQGDNVSSVLSSEEFVTTADGSLSKRVKRNGGQTAFDKRAYSSSQSPDQLLHSPSGNQGWPRNNEVCQDCTTEQNSNINVHFQSDNKVFCNRRNCSRCCLEHESFQSGTQTRTDFTFGTDNLVKGNNTKPHHDSPTQIKSREDSQLQLREAMKAQANEGTSTAIKIQNEDINMRMQPQHDPQLSAKKILATTGDDITVMDDSDLLQVASDADLLQSGSPTIDTDLMSKTEAKRSDVSPQVADEVNLKRFPTDVGISPVDETGSEMSSKRTKCLHVAATLANNAAAIILLLDHKLCEGTWRKTNKKEASEGVAHPTLPEGYSYGEEEVIKMEDFTPDVKDQVEPVPENKHLKSMKGHRRSLSFGTSVSKAITDAVNRLEEMSHESRNKQFHKLFKFIPEDEGLIVSFSCALLRDILLQGRLYLSENWVCFHSNIFTFETQVSVPMEDIENITKEKTVFVVPNAIGIHTNTHKYVFGSLLSRHSTYKQLVRIWQRRHLLDETTSQESGSRRESEPEVIDGEEAAMEAGTEADVEEDEDGDELFESPENPEGRLLGDVHVHAQHSDFESRRTPFRKSSSTTQQIHPSLVQIVLAQILTLIQALLAINIYKSLRRFIRGQPFIAFSSFLFFVLTTSAVILGYKIITFQSTNGNNFKDTHTQLSSLGNAFLSHHHQSHEKVSQLQERLVNQLQAMVHEADTAFDPTDGGS